MNRIDIYQVDAFTDRLFAGNPAAVCPLEEWIPDQTMQSIAAENNLAETAFIVRDKSRFLIRWFTPTIEVDLCGHATLASAFVLFNCLGHKEEAVKFYSPRSGTLGVNKKNEILFLDFPADALHPVHDDGLISQCIRSTPLEICKGKTDFIAVVENEHAVQSLEPDLKAISKLPGRGLIVTARGTDVDFVSRFFAPQSGVDEDPVTGSAHTSLIPLWSEKLGKNEMDARQLSKRGGRLICINKGERCLIGGQARLYMKGEINVE
jgi:PhzF family phenazine biosynthesis protein